MDTISERRVAQHPGSGWAGEMGTRIRAFDWASTPLGPMEQWPRSLCSTLDLMLDARFAMGLSWGPDFIHLYNDPVRGIYGHPKHPEALGRSTREMFSEMWDDPLGPIYRRIRETGESSYTVEEHVPFLRHGYLEETYFTSSNSAIWDSGQVGGILSIFVETTDRVLAERRLRTVQDLVAAAEAASPREACARAAEVLSRNALDVPFAVLYLCDDAGAVAHRAGLCGLPPEHPAAPQQVVLSRGAPGWPLAEVAGDGLVRVVDDADRRFGVPLDCGPWPEQPSRALVLPMRHPAQERPMGFLVAGISARRALDPVYAGFFRMVAGHVSTAAYGAMAREEERRRVEALSALDRAKTLFFSDVSHEFRTPLTLILGPLEQLEAELAPALTPGARELIATARRNGQRLRKLVDTVLDFARIEAGRVEVAPEPTDLAALTTELAAMFHSAAERAGLRLRIDCAPLSEPVWVDPEMWEKVVLNLLSNALKFTFAGEITVTLRAAGERVELAVRDTGVGIAEDELPQLFERFHRVRGVRARSHEGSGIGLALVNELTRLQGGAVRVDSTPDVGTTVTVSLPRGAGHLGPAQLRSAEGSGPPRSAATFVGEAAQWLRAPADRRGDVTAIGSPAGEPMENRPRARIAVVDDNADLRAYITRLLSTRFQVEAFADAGAALEAVGRWRPDLVLSDVMMPGLDGVQLVERLRSSPPTSAVPIILLSARAGEEATLEGLAAGADDYLVKPFSARELVARIDAQLAMARLRLLHATGAERDRLSRELHDSVTQTLITATVLAGELVNRSASGPEALAEEIRNLARITRGAMAEMRVLLTEMRPETVTRARLGHLVTQLADAVRGRVHLTVAARVRDTSAEGLPAEVRVALYRIAQETLNNAVKHSRATRVELALRATPEAVALCIRDDGVGFDPATPSDGMGLPGMRERAALVGATLRIHARPGGGTLVALRWPASAPAV